VDKPASWGTPIYSGAVAAGNTIVSGYGSDISVDVARLGELVAQDGYAVNGFASRPGLQWSLMGARSEQGAPIYTPQIGDTRAGLDGCPVIGALNVSWHGARASLIAAY